MNAAPGIAPQVPTRATWHEGEEALQRLAGIDVRMGEIGPRVIRDHMPDQHRAFFAQLPFLVTGTLDAEGQPWAGVLAAPAGFAHSPDAGHLRIDARPAAGDPMAPALVPGAPIGLLGIEPHTGRRNRMNGVVEAVDARGFTVRVQQSFGNCPKYIQAREPRFAGRTSPAAPAVQRTTCLDERARRIVREADTFFIATAHPGAGPTGSEAQGVDVSHRGGRPGFVRLSGEGTLTVPDFVGNSFFSTLGNIAVNPRAGLLFVDFESGDLLRIAVTAGVIWNGPEVQACKGAERLLRMQVVAVQHAVASLPLRWGPASLSPYLARMG